MTMALPTLEFLPGRGQAAVRGRKTTDNDGNGHKGVYPGGRPFRALPRRRHLLGLHAAEGHWFEPSAATILLHGPSCVLDRAFEVLSCAT